MPTGTPPLAAAAAAAAAASKLLTASRPERERVEGGVSVGSCSVGEIAVEAAARMLPGAAGVASGSGGGATGAAMAAPVAHEGGGVSASSTGPSMAARSLACGPRGDMQ
jgi:hypothetical protein